jgi:four helix bundle protein
MSHYRDLQVWRKSHLLTVDVYRLTAAFPKTELCGLTSQLRRASSSVPTNIAEGCGRSSDAELVRFLAIAKGSANELEYELLLARDVGYIKPEDYDRLMAGTDEVGKMLRALISSLRLPQDRQRLAARGSRLAG